MPDYFDDLRDTLRAKRVSRRAFLGGTLGLTAGALLAACGGDDNGGDDAATNTPASGGGEPTATSGEAAAEATATSSGDTTTVRDYSEVTVFENAEIGAPDGAQPTELIIVWGANQFTTHGIDPQLHVGTVAEAQLRHMYEPLVAFESDLVTISPVLATEWERIDDLTFQFKLREGVTYHNGEEFNAEAVRYSVLRPLSDETPGDSRSTYAIITDVEVVDDYTVNVITSAPDPALLARMTGFHMTMVAPEWASQGPEVVAAEAVGTGPYRFVSWSPNEDLVMEANEEYWGEVPTIKNVRLSTITEQSTRVAALRAGDVHVIKDVPPEEVQSLNDSGRARAFQTVSNRVPFYFMTTEIEPYSDPLVRQAINYAANVDGVIEAILLGNGERVSTVLGKWIYGFDPALAPYPYDPERAMELLTEAGYPDGIDIDIWFREGRYPKDREVAEAMAGEMAAANIRCTPHLLEASVLDEMQQSKETPGLIFASWGNWFFDADNTFVPLFGCEQAEAFNDWRRPYGCNEEFEEIIQAARIELDPDTRLELYAQAQQFMYEDGAALFMYQLVDIFGIDNWVVWEPRHDEMMWAHEMSWNTA